VDFSVFMIAMGRGRRSDREIFEYVMADVALAEELGFNAVWFAEHHFRADFSLSPAPNVFIAAAAAITERINLGAAVNVLPFHHPVTLAEQGAMLDVLTDGRFQWGIGRGIAGAEFAPWGIDPAESRDRFREVHDAVIQAWTTGRVGFEGRFYRVADAPLVPSIVQGPHPPVWVSAQSPDSVTWAAEHGYRVMQVGEPLDRGREHAQRYAEVVASQGVAADPRGAIVPLRYVHVAETDEAARKACASSIGEFWSHFSRIAAPGGSASKAKGYEYWNDAKTSLQQYADLGYDGLNEEGIIITGSPETVIEGVQRQIDELGVTHLMCDFWRGAPSMDDRRESMRLFATEVMPAFQQAGTATSVAG